jgi:hypothetical protein
MAAAFSKITLFSIGTLLWCALEMSLALATGTLERYGIGTSVFPQNLFTAPPDKRFIYHPLLQIVPRPNWEQKIRYDYNDLRDIFKSQINWAEIKGKEFIFSHNSVGLRGAELTVHDLTKDMIFVYGGSTTYDFMVTQGATWVEQLQSGLNDKYTIVNFGTIGHSTTEHLIHTAFYQNVLGKKPVCAMYYVGWNDISSAHTKNLDSAYSNWHLIADTVRRDEIWGAKYSPLLKLVDRAVRKRFDSVPEPISLSGERPIAGSDSRLEEFFIEHVRAIAAINSSRGIKSVFIGQMLNRDLYSSVVDPESNDAFSTLIKNRDVWPFQERFNMLLKRTSISVGVSYIDAGIENFKYSDFADWGHFSATGSKKFAALISKQVDSDCR